MSRRASWEQQPGESDEAYYWFCRFRDLPPAERSIERLLSDVVGTPDELRLEMFLASEDAP